MGMAFAPTWLRQVSPPPASQNHFNHCSYTDYSVTVYESSHGVSETQEEIFRRPGFRPGARWGGGTYNGPQVDLQLVDVKVGAPSIKTILLFGLSVLKPRPFWSHSSTLCPSQNARSTQWRRSVVKSEGVRVTQVKPSN